MTMQWLERELRRTGDPADTERADLVATLLKNRGRDIPLPPTEDLLKEKEYAESALRTEIINAYLNEPHAPELVTRTWEFFWTLSLSDRKYDFIFSVPQCNRSQEELEALRKNGYMMVYVPEVLSKRETRHNLHRIFQFPVFYTGVNGTIFPDKELKVFNSVSNVVDQYGWLDIEAGGREIPYWRDIWLKGNEKLKALTELFDSKGRIGQTLNTYIIGSEFHKFVFREALDMPSTLETSALLGSRLGNQPVFVMQDSSGSGIYLDNNLYCVKGGRSAGTKKVA